MPAARQASRSPAMAFAVIATIHSRPVRPSLADAPRGAQPVELGHLDVHEHHVERLRAPARRSPASPSVATSAAYAICASSRSASLLVHGVVLGEEDAQRVTLAEVGRIAIGRPPAPAAGRVTRRPEQDRCDRVVQGGRLDRLRQPGRHRRSLAVAQADRREDDDGRRRRAAVRRGADDRGRRARRRPSRASGDPTARCRIARPPRASRAPRAASPSRAAPSPTRAVCATRIRRFVALSSTMSTVRPGEVGLDPHRARGRHRAAAATGMRTMRWKTLPSPATPLLSAVSEPSISSARRRLIARPRPVPP